MDVILKAGQYLCCIRLLNWIRGKSYRCADIGLVGALVRVCLAEKCACSCNPHELLRVPIFFSDHCWKDGQGVDLQIVHNIATFFFSRVGDAGLNGLYSSLGIVSTLLIRVKFIIDAK